MGIRRWAIRMKSTNLNQGISHLLERYKFLEKVKTFQPSTLFEVEPAWEKLKEGRCPICASILKKPRGRSISICYGKRHGDKKKFIIKNETLEKLSTP